MRNRFSADKGGVTPARDRHVDPVIACFAVAFLAALGANLVAWVTGASARWLAPLSWTALIVGGVLVLSLGSWRRRLDRTTELLFAALIVIGCIGLFRWLV